MKKILIANSGEIAVRIARASADLDIRSVAGLVTTLTIEAISKGHLRGNLLNGPWS